MTNYAAEPKKSAKSFENDEIRKGAASLAESAESFIKDAKKNVGEMACEGTKFLKEEGTKDIRKARDFLREHPVKGAAYAVGIGALLSYFLIPRK